MGLTMDLYVVTNVLVVKPQLDPAKAFLTLRALEARSTQSRAWGPKVKWVSSVTPSILGVLFSGATASPIRSWGWSWDWLVLDVNLVTLEFWGAIASCLPLAHLTALEMSTAMAMVLLGGFCWLKLETTLAEMGSRAEVVECLGLKLCWEGWVSSAFTMDGRMSRSSIFTARQNRKTGL